MRKLVLGIILTCTCVFAFNNSDEFINEINSKQNSWKAGRNFHKDTPISQLHGLLGTEKVPRQVLREFPIMKHKIDDAIPESFDARTQWPKCTIIKKIADQSACKASWAVSVTSIIQDRICILSNGTQQPEISAKNLIACQTKSHGCQGGSPYFAFDYWHDNGLVTGGQYGSEVGCQPYPFAQCEHFTKGDKPSCPTDLYNTPECVQKCDNSSMKYFADLHYGESSYTMEQDVSQIQQEIMTNGPVITLFDVYDDLLHYKTGVYKRTTAEYYGLHSVKIIGWGVENGVKYWLAANSWNEDWGDKGLFKILRGTNECGFEDSILAGLPKMN